MNDRGAISVVLLAVAVLALLFALALGDAARFMAARLEAITAADAAALAAAPVTFRPFGAAGTPEEEAARFAAANGAVLLSCSCPLDRSWEERSVVVVVGRRVSLLLFGDRPVTATGRAEFVPAALLGEG